MSIEAMPVNTDERFQNNYGKNQKRYVFFITVSIKAVVGQPPSNDATYADKLMQRVFVDNRLAVQGLI